jgi:hypothetical protein
MNHLTRIISLAVLVSVGLFYTGCDGGDDDEKSQEQIQLEKLVSSEWTLFSAKDPTDRTSEYPGMTLSISGTFASEGGTYNYTSSATSWPSASPWDKESSWKFLTGSVGTKIIRLSDDQEMTYTLSNSDKQLTIAFIYSSTTGFENVGRAASVSGNWEFIFTRP